LCKLEYEDHDSAYLKNNLEKDTNELPGLTKSPFLERFHREEKMIELGSPMRIEDEFEMLSFQQKDQGNLMEYDFLSGN